MGIVVKSLSVLIVLVGFFFALTEPCYANALSPLDPIIWKTFFILLISSPLIEAGVISAISKPRIQQGGNWLRLFKAVWIINLITFVPTQLFAYFLFNGFGSHSMGFLAEIFPLVVEYFMLKQLFAKLYGEGMLLKPFSNRTVALLTILANLVTFGLGQIPLWLWW